MKLKIASITNLTDARFFSAAGANYLGFCFDVLNEQTISIAKAKEIINWLHEPAIIGEFGSHQTREEIAYIAEEMGLIDIQIPFSHPQKEALAFEKFLQTDDWTSIEHHQFSDFIVLKIKEDAVENDSLKYFIQHHKVFIETDFTKENCLQIIETLQPYGIQFTCKKEEKIGLSLVDEYAEILDIIGFS